MLKHLMLEGVGPATTFGPVEFSPRLNFITGDNGLGKSFILDIAWSSLTRTWARNNAAVPHASVKKPSIKYSYSKTTSGDVKDSITFKREDQSWQWPLKKGRPAIPGVVIYAGVDGSFSVWDPSRNFWLDEESNGRQRSFDFSPKQVWDGLRGADGTSFCNGLISDWVLWQSRSDPAFTDLIKVLEVLSPSDTELLTPGKPVRSGYDVKEYPSLLMPYGQEVALSNASAGMRRITALAYLLVWTWKEHLLASERSGRSKAKEVIFLIDEIECHLHPQWQRRVVPALLKVMEALTGKKVSVQIIVATHSPLVLSSVEPTFDENLDRVFNIKMENREAKISVEPWSKQGDIANWLVSDIFGLQQARSIEAEKAIEAAEALMRGDTDALPDGLKSKEDIHKELKRVLAGHDDFWPRWLVSTKQVPGALPEA